MHREREQTTCITRDTRAYTKIFKYMQISAHTWTPPTSGPVGHMNAKISLSKLINELDNQRRMWVHKPTADDVCIECGYANQPQNIFFWHRLTRLQHMRPWHALANLGHTKREWIIGVLIMKHLHSRSKRHGHLHGCSEVVFATIVWGQRQNMKP